MGDDNQTPAEMLRAHRQQGVDNGTALDVLIDEVRASRREMRNGFEAVNARLAKGDTAIALMEERQSNQGTSIASLTKRFDEIERMTRALACEDCEDRIEKLERSEEARQTIDAEGAKRRAWQPPWWLMLLLTIIAGVATAVLAARMGASA